VPESRTPDPNEREARAESVRRERRARGASGEREARAESGNLTPTPEPRSLKPATRNPQPATRSPQTALLTKAWCEQTCLGKLKAKLKDSEDRCAGSELMVAFLKEQLTATGLVPRALPESAREQEVLKANAVLDSLLAQIPSGVVGEFDLDAAMARAPAPAQHMAAAPSEISSKLGMLWAEVRELVATSSAGRLLNSEGAPPAPGPQVIQCF